MGNFLFINVADKQAQALSSALANKTCRLILDSFKEHPKKAVTESDIAKKLSLPISTVHYNIQQLVKSGLIVGDQYTYSKKGKEMIHYRLTDKFIVIAPQASALEDVLKSLVPALGIIAVGAAFVAKLVPQFNPQPAMMAVALDSAAQETTGAMMKAIPIAQESVSAQPNYMLWFLGISILVFAVLLAVQYAILHFKRS